MTLNKKIFLKIKIISSRLPRILKELLKNKFSKETNSQKYLNYLKIKKVSKMIIF